MTKEREEAILDDLRLLAGDLKGDELPDWMAARGRALQFYGRFRRGTDGQEKLLALYNAYVALMGPALAAQTAERDLGGSAGRLRRALERCRREGDASSGGGGALLTDGELETLARGLRRRILSRET